MDPLGIEPGSSDCQPDVFPLDHEPVCFSGPPGSRTPISWLQARCRPVGPAAHIDLLQRSVRDSNPAFLRTEEVCRQKHLQTVLQNDPGWSRTIALLVVTQASLPLDHWIVSDRSESRTHRITRLSGTAVLHGRVALPVCVPGHVARLPLARQIAGSGIAPDGPGL